MSGPSPAARLSRRGSGRRYFEGMYAADMLAGDQFRNSSDELVWTALWDVMTYSQTTVGTTVEWASDGGRTVREWKSDIDIPGLTRPEPPEV